MTVQRKVLILGSAICIALSAMFVWATSDQACQSAWSQSAASSSCSGGQSNNTSAFVEWRASRQECVVAAYCQGPGGSSNNYNQVYGTTSEVRELKNCNGTLKASC